MLRYSLSPSAARKRFDDLCYSLNQRQGMLNFIRTASDGTTKKVQRTRKAISDGAQATGKALIQLYASRLKEVHAMLPEAVLSPEPPSLSVNNVKLAGYRQNVTDRTIRNHMKTLKDIGLVSAYKFHGTRQNFEIWLSTEILFGPDFATLSSTPTPQFCAPDSTGKMQTSPAAPAAPECINFPLKHTKDTYGNSKTSTSNVEESDLYGKPEMATTPSGRRSCQNDTLDAKNGNKERGAARGADVDNYVDNRWKSPEASPSFNKLHPYFYRAVRSLFSYARISLWPDRVFSEQEYSRTAELLTTGWYLPFIQRKPNQHQFDAWQHQMSKAIDVAARYYRNHPEQHPGDPYSSPYSPNGYFDAANPRGFQVAINWQFRNQEADVEAKANRIIKAAVRHLQNHESGKIPKHLQGKTYLELYQFYQAKMQPYPMDLRHKFVRHVLATRDLKSFTSKINRT